MKRVRILLIAALMGFTLAGCDAKTEEKTGSYILPPELAEKGCKIYLMDGDQTVSRLWVVYCPNAQVTTTSKVGKQNISVSTVYEGRDYGY